MTTDSHTLQVSEIEYLCFEGGGAKGTGYLGAIVALEELGLLPLQTGNNSNIKGISGASIGSIVGMGIGMGYTAKDLNARLIKDQALKALHAEPQREGMTRSLEKTGQSGGRIEQGITKKKATDAFPKIKDLANGELKGLLEKNLKDVSDFFTVWMIESVKASLTSDKFMTEYLFTGAQKAILKKRDYILSWMLFIDAFQYLGGLSEDILDDSQLNGSVDMPTNNQYLSAQFLAWLESDPFKTGAFETEENRRDVVRDMALGTVVLILTSLIVASLTLYLQPKKFDQEKNKMLVLRLIAENMAYNALNPGNYQSLYSLTKDLKKIIKDARSVLTVGDDIGGYFEETGKAVFDKILGFITTGPFEAAFNGIIKDGGLFTGVTIRAVLAEMIQAKVEWTKEDGFKKRETPLNWGDQNSRDTNPAALNKFSGESHNETRLAFEEISRRINYNEDLKKSGWDRDRKLAGLYKQRDRLTPKYKKYLEEKPKIDEETAEREKELKTELSKIMTSFSIAEYHRIFEVDLSFTGTNTSTNRTVYFNRHLTPGMPVVDAVGMSSAFPFLFKPVRLAYTEDKDTTIGGYNSARVAENYIENNSEIYPADSHNNWYRENYHGWFIDGGLLNNFPLSAFNARAASQTSQYALSPINMQHVGLPKTIFGMVLDSYNTNKKGETFHNWEVSAEEFSNQKTPPGILPVVMSVAYGASMNHATMEHIPTKLFKNKQVVLLDTDGLSIFDLTPRDSSLRKVDFAAYQAVIRNFDGSAKLTMKTLGEALERDNKESRRWRQRPTQRYARRRGNQRYRQLSRQR